MMTHTFDLAAALPSVASVSSQGPGESSSVNGPPRSVERYSVSSSDPPVSLQAKQGQAAQYRLSKFNQQVNSIAKSLRLGNQALAKIDSILEKAKRPLIKIVKSFPPFPAGSEERVKLLKSFNAYRKMIDKLTVPPADGESLQVLSGQTDPDEIVNKLFGRDAMGEETLPGDFPQMLKEVEIPDLAISTNDEKIEIAIKKINDGQSSVQEARAKIFNKAMEIREQLRLGHPYGESIGQQESDGSTSDDVKMDAIGLSHHIKKGLLSNSAGYMHAERSVMISLL